MLKILINLGYGAFGLYIIIFIFLFLSFHKKKRKIRRNISASCSNKGIDLDETEFITINEEFLH